MNNSQPIALYLGNESCDLDSVVSPLALAYAANALPVLNVRRHELRLRRDVVQEVAHAGVEITALVCLDELPQQSLDHVLANGGSLTLVDHNQLTISQESSGKYVVAIVDHHADARLYPQAARTMARTGSCASLVSQYLPDDSSIPNPLAKLLLSAVLADTSGLRKHTTDVDVKAADRLSALACCPRKEWDALLRRISEAHHDLSGFTARDILLKDYKAFKGGAYSAGISSVGKSLAAWIQEDSLTSALCADALEKLLVEKNVDVIMVMTAFKDASTGVFHREILVHGKSIVADSIRKQLGDKDAMKLQRFEIADTALGTCFVQRNLEATRKVVAPHVVDILSNIP